MSESEPVSEAIADPLPPPPKPWRPVAGLAERPSRMAFSDRLFYWFVYAGGLGLIGVGVLIIGWSPHHLGWKVGAIFVGLGFGLFAFGGPDGAATKGYRH